MQIDLSILLTLFGGVSVILFSIYYIFFHSSSQNCSDKRQNDTKKSQNSKGRKKKKISQVKEAQKEHHLEQKETEKFSSENLIEFIKKSEISFELSKNVVNLLLKQVPRENWREVLPSAFQDTSHALKLAEKDSEISKMKIEIHSLGARLENAEDEVRFCSKAAKGVEESFRARITKLEEEIGRLEGILAKSSAEYGGLESDLRKKLNSAKRAELEAKNTESRLQAEKADLVYKLKEAEAYNGHEVAAAKDKLIQVIQEEITATNRRLVSAGNTAETLRRQLAATDGGNLAQMSEQLAEKLALTETKVTQLTSAVAELTNEKQRVEAALEEKTRALAAARQSVDEQSPAEFDRLTRDCEVLMVRVAEAQGEVGRLRAGKDDDHMNGNHSSILDGLANSGL